jgi:hypothetical protein
MGVLEDSAVHCCQLRSCLIERNSSDTHGRMLSVMSGPQGPVVLPADDNGIQCFTDFSALCFCSVFFKAQLQLQEKIQEL